MRAVIKGLEHGRTVIQMRKEIKRAIRAAQTVVTRACADIQRMSDEEALEQDDALMDPPKSISYRAWIGR